MSLIKDFTQYTGPTPFDSRIFEVDLMPGNPNLVIVLDATMVLIFDHTLSDPATPLSLTDTISGSASPIHALFCKTTSSCYAYKYQGGTPPTSIMLYSFNPSGNPIASTFVQVGSAISITQPLILPMLLIDCVGVVNGASFMVYKLTDGSGVASVSVSLTVPIFISDSRCSGTACEVAIFGDTGQMRTYSVDLTGSVYSSKLITSFSYPSPPAEATAIRITEPANGYLVSFNDASLYTTALVTKMNCDPNCATCSGPSSNECLSCLPTKVLIGTDCVTCHSSCLPAACTGPNANQCTNCNNAGGLYLKPDFTCVQCATTPGFLISGTNCSPCDSTCGTCITSSTNCRTCSDPNNFLRKDASNSCLPDCPAGKFSYTDAANSNQMTCDTCSASCLACQTSASRCTSCNIGLYLNPATNSCQTACDQLCLTCSVKSTNCATCPVQGKLQLLPDGTSTCVDNTVNITLSFVVVEAANCSESLLSPKFCIEVSLTNKTLTDADFNTIITKFQVQATLMLEVGDFTSNFEKQPLLAPKSADRSIKDSVLSLNYSFADVVPGSPRSRLSLASTTDNQMLIMIGRIRYFQPMVSFITRAWAPPPSASVNSAGQLGESTGGLVTGNPIPSQSAMQVLGAVAASDPTGVLSRFNQLLKIVNKLAFVETNYGPLLERFFSSIVATSGTLTEDASDQLYKASRSFRRKLLRYRVTLSFLTPALLWKSAVYLISFMINLAPLVMEKLRVRCPKWTLFLLAHWDRIHLVLFNFVFTDILFYGTNSMVRGGSSGLTQVAACLLTFIVTVDLTRFTSLCFRDTPWTYHYRRLRAADEDTQKANPSGGQSTIKAEANKDAPVKSLDSQHDQSAQHLVTAGTLDASERHLDYSSSYELINFRIHTVDLFTETFRMNKDVFASRACRTAMLIHFLRVGAYQCLTISGQYSCKLVLAVLAVAEGSRIVLTIRNQVKLKPYRSLLFMVMDLSQSSFLLAFELVFIFATTEAKADPTENTQKFGIWLIIVSTAVEYLLILCFLVFVTFQAVKSCRKKKPKGKMGGEKASAWTHFLKYRTGREIDEAGDGFVEGMSGSGSADQGWHTKASHDSPGSQHGSVVNGRWEQSTESSTSSLQGRKLFAQKQTHLLAAGGMKVHPSGMFTQTAEPKKWKRDILPARYKQYESSSKFFDSRKAKEHVAQVKPKAEYL